MSRPLAALVAALLLGGGVAAIAVGGGALKAKVGPTASHEATADTATEPVRGKQTNLRVGTATASPEVGTVAPTEPSPVPRAPAATPTDDQLLDIAKGSAT